MELRLLRLGKMRLLRGLRELMLLLRILILSLSMRLILMERDLGVLCEWRVLLLLVWIMRHSLLLQLL